MKLFGKTVTKMCIRDRFCNRRILASEENEDKYLRGCSHECRVHPRNRYVTENGLSQEEVVARLAAIGESLDVTPA